MKPSRRIVVTVAVAALAVGGLTYADQRRRRRHRAALSDHDLNLTEPAGERRRVRTSDGADLLTVRIGDPAGPTVVLAHCWTCSKTTWLPVARRLADVGCRVIRWDQRGHGESSSGTDGNQIPRLGDDLAAVMAEWDATDAVLAGHSMGGMTVMEYAARHPDDFEERVRAVVLVDTAASGMDNLMIRQAHSTVSNQSLEGLMRNPKFGHLLQRGTFGTWAAREHLERATTDYLNSPADVRAEFSTQFPELDLDQVISGITKPTSVIVGVNDILTPVKLAEEMAERIPDATLQIIPGAGHMTPFEAPDAVAAAILTHVPLGPTQPE